jgi:hypothetical protein
MINYTADVWIKLEKQFFEQYDGTTVFEDWINLECKKLGIKRIPDFIHAYVFETIEDELVFRIRFGL